jgi:hypothetical protein
VVLNTLFAHSIVPAKSRSACWRPNASRRCCSSCKLRSSRRRCPPCPRHATGARIARLRSFAERLFDHARSSSAGRNCANACVRGWGCGRAGRELAPDHRPECAVTASAARKATEVLTCPPRLAAVATHAVAWSGPRAAGPEHESGWWDDEDIRRDHLVETSQGQRAWASASRASRPGRSCCTGGSQNPARPRRTPALDFSFQRGASSAHELLAPNNRTRRAGHHRRMQRGRHRPRARHRPPA